MVDKTGLALLPGMCTKTAVNERLVDQDRVENAVDRCGVRSRVVLWVLALVVGMALTALTVARELEAAALRRKMDALAADMLLLQAQHHALRQKVDHVEILKNVQMFDNLNFGDIAEESDIIDGELHDSVEKMDTLTTSVDGEADVDDDTFVDEEDGTSGDYYMDYGNRKREEAKSNLVRPWSEDWVEDVASSAPVSVSARLRARTDSSPGGSTAAGGVRVRRSVAGGSADLTAPRDLFKTNDRNTKRYDSRQAEVGEEGREQRRPSAARTPRNTEQEGERRPFVAAHFHGNTSHLVLGVDEYYHGNGLVRTPHEEAHSAWWPAAWTAAAPRPRPTLAGRGRVLVHRSGVYLVYAQVYYFDAHDTVGWVLHRTNVEREGRDALLQCTHASPSVDHMDKPNSCFSAAALLLRAGDRLAVRNTGGERHAIMNPEKSFIGLVQLADADDPDSVEL